MKVTGNPGEWMRCVMVEVLWRLQANPESSQNVENKFIIITILREKKQGNVIIQWDISQEN